MSIRILLVDDNAANQKILLFHLKKLGYDADVASNGQEGVEAAQRQTYDVVLMDVQMPVMDGIEATRHLRAELPLEQQPFIIAVTANASDVARQQCHEAGMNLFLSKPVTTQALGDAIASAPTGRAPVPRQRPSPGPASQEFPSAV